jgi:hypothetical protein
VDSESVALASTAAATLVTLLTTDVWAKAKQEIAGLWRRFRPEHAEVVEAELTDARVEALAGGEAVASALATEWESRLRRLLAADAAAAGELARVAELLTRMAAEQGRNVAISQQVTASGHAAVVQVAGDAHLSETVLGARARRPGAETESDGHLP